MGESGDRLRFARKRAKFKSARAAALKFGWNPSTYASHENGQTAVPKIDAVDYGRAFKVSPAWILYEQGPMEAQNTVKIMGRIGAGAEISPEMEQVPEDGLEEIDLPFAVGLDAVAFEVSGTSMMPRYDPGAIVICSTTTRDPEDFIGDEVAVRTTNGKRYLKKLRRGSKRGFYNLESFNDEAIENVRIAWLGEVLNVVSASWRRRHALTKQRVAG